MSTPPTSPQLQIRLARSDDSDAIRSLMQLAIGELQKGFLTEAQIEASAEGMGIDPQLIEDGTYFTVWSGHVLVGCGGWSYRARRYGGDKNDVTNIRRLDPVTERARIRAMYTHPDYVRQGIGRMVIDAAEAAVRAAGFGACELVATMSGMPLYLKCGYNIESEWFDENGAVRVPVATMTKPLT